MAAAVAAAAANLVPVAFSVAASPNPSAERHGNEMLRRTLNKPRNKYEISLFALNKSVALCATTVNLATWRIADGVATHLDAKVPMKLICWEQCNNNASNPLQCVGKMLMQLMMPAVRAVAPLGCCTYFAAVSACAVEVPAAMCLRCSTACGMAVTVDGRDYNER